MEGDTVILKFKVYSNTKSTWNRIESKDSQEYQKIIPYADGKEINPSLPNTQNIEIVGNIDEGDYNLKIQQVSSNDEGNYICSQTRNGSDAQEFCFILKMAGNNLNINIACYAIAVNIQEYYKCHYSRSIFFYDRPLIRFL